MTTLDEQCNRDVPPVNKESPKKQCKQDVGSKQVPAACKQALQAPVYEIPTPGPSHFADLKHPRAAAGDAGYALLSNHKEPSIPWYKHHFLRQFLKCAFFFCVAVKIARDMSGHEIMK
ncbi:hypothetical protein J437_LFUL003849 [Ladona fulva]|uniref:Uncharacterized protein n=1 Tax=Ladona fulva TaxID=123851 RepID=A0A8K0P6A2_LADFU|nr:hypothetical protein J437_LFUL003849 [Ladona fulva]